MNIKNLFAVLFFMPYLANAVIYLDSAGQEIRQKINNPTDLRPQIGLVVRMLPDQVHAYFCTGALVGPSVVLTAAHCVIDENQNVSKVFFAANFVEKKHLGKSNSKEIEIGTKDWNRNISEDWAVIHLEDRLGDKVGFFSVEDENQVGSSALEFAGYQMNSSGGLDMYKTPKCYFRSWFNPGVFSTDCSATEGSSGGSILHTDLKNNKTSVVGIFTRGYWRADFLNSFDRNYANYGVASSRFINVVKKFRELYDK